MNSMCNLITDRQKKLVDYLKTTTFMTDPASARYHGNHKGGLLIHSLNVSANLGSLTATQGLIWERIESPYIIGLAHDMCKIGAYLSDGNGGYAYNHDQPKGHGDLSVRRVKEVIDITDEEEACIRWHMGAYEWRESKAETGAVWNQYNEAIKRFPNVLYTHTADMIATFIDEKEALT